MARGRLISKSLGSSRKFHALHGAVGKLAEFCQALYPLLISGSDDFGRMKADAFTVKHAVFPTSPRSVADFDKALVSLAKVRLLTLYSAEGETYLQINDFDMHQPNLHKRTVSLFPEPPPESPGDSGLARAPGTQENSRELNLREPITAPPEGEAAPDFDRDFWALYPKREAKEAARKAWHKLNPDEALWATMAAALSAQVASPRWLRDGGQYIPYPATWLNGRRWEDEPEAPARDGPKAKGGGFDWQTFQAEEDARDAAIEGRRKG